MPQESMTPKERWLAVLQRKTPDRVPMDYWGTDETMAKLMRHLQCSESWDVFRKLHIDRVWSVSPEYVGPPFPKATMFWAAAIANVSYGTGVYPECITIRWPNMKQWRKWQPTTPGPTPIGGTLSVIPDQLVGKEEYPIQGGGSNPFCFMPACAVWNRPIWTCWSIRNSPSIAWTSYSTWPTRKRCALTSRFRPSHAVLCCRGFRLASEPALRP